MTPFPIRAAKSRWVRGCSSGGKINVILKHVKHTEDELHKLMEPTELMRWKCSLQTIHERLHFFIYMKSERIRESSRTRHTYTYSHTQTDRHYIWSWSCTKETCASAAMGSLWVMRSIHVCEVDAWVCCAHYICVTGMLCVRTQNQIRRKCFFMQKKSIYRKE